MPPKGSRPPKVWQRPKTLQHQKPEGSQPPTMLRNMAEKVSMKKPQSLRISPPSFHPTISVQAWRIKSSLTPCKQCRVPRDSRATLISRTADSIALSWWGINGWISSKVGKYTMAKGRVDGGPKPTPAFGNRPALDAIAGGWGLQVNAAAS